MDGGHPGGGSRELGQLIDEYGEQLAADLLEVYGVDLRDIFNPKSRLTPLWILVLVKGLSEGSRFVAECRGGPEFRGWDAGRYAQVATVNAVRALQYTYITAHAKSRPKPPDSFPIPDKKIRQQSSNSFAAMAAAQMTAGRKVAE